MEEKRMELRDKNGLTEAEFLELVRPYAGDVQPLPTR